MIGILIEQEYIENGAAGRSRTGTEITFRGILNPLRLPVSPPRHC